LIYASVEQNLQKKEKSIDILNTLISNNQLILSTLTLQEFVFTMAKLKIEHTIIQQDSDFFSKFIDIEYDFLSLKEAITTCCAYNYCKNINDVIHLHLAKKSKAHTLMTFDEDFKKLNIFKEIKIEIL